MAKAFCDTKGEIRTARTPNSFLSCQFSVIEHAWNQLSSVGLAAALFATKRWYTIDEVDELVAGAQVLVQSLGLQNIGTASCDGLWHFMGTEDGPAVVLELCNDLGRDKFATASCDGLWHFMGTEDGPAVVQEWRNDLGRGKGCTSTHDFATSSVPHG